MFSLTTLAMLMGLCYSANLLTMYLCFEFVTLLSMPLVLHSLSTESVNAAKKYLFYSIISLILSNYRSFLVKMYKAITT